MLREYLHDVTSSPLSRFPRKDRKLTIHPTRQLISNDFRHLDGVFFPRDIFGCLPFSLSVLPKIISRLRFPMELLELHSLTSGRLVYISDTDLIIEDSVTLFPCDFSKKILVESFEKSNRLGWVAFSPRKRQDCLAATGTSENASYIEKAAKPDEII